jgi:hypothetical protein
MDNLLELSRNRAAGLVLALVLTLAALVAPPGAQATFKWCFKQSFTSHYWFYYDPGLTRPAGMCDDDCGQCTCTGVVTNYYRAQDVPGCP